MFGLPIMLKEKEDFGSTMILLCLVINTSTVPTESTLQNENHQTIKTSIRIDLLKTTIRDYLENFGIIWNIFLNSVIVINNILTITPLLIINKYK